MVLVGQSGPYTVRHGQRSRGPSLGNPFVRIVLLNVSVTASPESSPESTTEEGSCLSGNLCQHVAWMAAIRGIYRPPTIRNRIRPGSTACGPNSSGLSETLNCAIFLSKYPNTRPERQSSSSKYAVPPLLPLGRDGNHRMPKLNTPSTTTCRLILATKAARL